MFKTKFLETNKGILYSVTFIEIRTFWDKVKNYCTAGQATDYITVHAHYMLDT